MCYFEKAIDPKYAENTLNRLVKSIQKSRIKYDFIVVRGLSGAVLATALTIALKKPVVIVRKKKESTHGCDVEFPNSLRIAGKSYIFVDDGISTGATLVEVLKGMADYLRVGENAFIKGVFLYCQDDICSWAFEADRVFTLEAKIAQSGYVNDMRIPVYHIKHGKKIILKVA